MWVLGTELQASTLAVSALIHGAIYGHYFVCQFEIWFHVAQVGLELFI